MSRLPYPYQLALAVIAAAGILGGAIGLLIELMHGSRR